MNGDPYLEEMESYTWSPITQGEIARGTESYHRAGRLAPSDTRDPFQYIEDIQAGRTQAPTVVEAVIPGVGGLTSALQGVLPALAKIGAVAGAGWAGYQALGGGEGGGIGGLNILGGSGAGVDGIPLGGPGMPEPPSAWIEKEWQVNYSGFKLQYYLVRMPRGGRRIAMFNTRTGKWKTWRWTTPTLAVIGKNMPSHKQLTRLKRNLKRHTADARTILKLTSPTTYAKHIGYRKYKRRSRG